MSKDKGFLQLRRGVWEHIRDGRMSLADCAVHAYITSQADTRTGVWNGSAGALAGELTISPRKARRFLERLDRGDYTKRFPTPGKHACYPILVHKFLITDGEHKGEQLNAIASTSPVDLRYFSGEQEGEHKGEHVTSQKRIENREQRKMKTPAAKTAPPADPRHKPFFDFAYEAYRVKHGQPPTWGAREGKTLKAFLKEHAVVPLEEWRLRWAHYLDSTENFTRKQGDSLTYFLGHFDSFIAGPLRDAGRKENISADQRTLDNLVAAGLRPAPQPN
ncbi:MAG: hypothetical protein LAN84_04095 [Acidobacteriia bacterium]|nr:hypothetical protein [Terriglobia bacterium]